jgi:hypothetical protein
MFVCRSGAADGGRRRSRLCRGKWCSVCRLAARPRKCRTRSSGRCGRTLFSPYISARYFLRKKDEFFSAHEDSQHCPQQVSQGK